jgi:hypothetical protein
MAKLLYRPGVARRVELQILVAQDILVTQFPYVDSKERPLNTGL